MKLINKTISYYLLICIPLLLLAAVNSYYVTKGQIEEVSNEVVGQELMHAQVLIQNFDKPQQMQFGFDNLSSIKITNPHKDKFIWSDTIIYNVFEKEDEPYRMAKMFYNSNGETYLVTALKPTLEEEDLMEGIFSSFIVILVFLILAFFLVSWLIAKKLWTPFYDTLTKLNNYNINQHSLNYFENSTIKEFNQLNQSLNKMTDKLYFDFIQQKEFTENASHEMQTPLAVVKANLSLLMQSSNLKEEEMNQLQSIENTVKKLTALNKALILLSKIENHQYNESIAVNFNDKMKSIINHNQDLLDSKNISLETKFANELIVPFNTTLADVLITNLLQNAIRHNKTNGDIRISIKDKSITISNSGEPLSVSEDELFTRFKKNDASKDSIGLGLSIVKSISTLYNIKISYKYTSNLHVFTLQFN
jgi:signal transduction histidine kinase